MNKELILNVDDLGLHFDTVKGVEELWEKQIISSVSILSNSPGIEQTLYALKKTGVPCGVHLTLTDGVPLSPKDNIHSALTENGRFFTDVNKAMKRVQPEEALAEFSAQIEHLQCQGIKLSHLDCHKGVCFFRPELLSVYGMLGKKYGLPLALPNHTFFNETRKDVPGSTDSLVGIYDLPVRETFKNRSKAYDRMLSGLGEGRHYCFSHPVPPTEQVQLEMPDWQIRNNDYALFLSPEWKELLVKYDITMGSF